ncbi:hypothetical protein EDB89DRAFT_1971312 [Lactarius sanguifluus]|nr:hypothetical protein EDB89DRAFT_1971312 [Lactarius sanguifluus]
MNDCTNNFSRENTSAWLPEHPFQTQPVRLMWTKGVPLSWIFPNASGLNVLFLTDPAPISPRTRFTTAAVGWMRASIAGDLICENARPDQMATVRFARACIRFCSEIGLSSHFSYPLIIVGVALVFSCAPRACARARFFNSATAALPMPATFGEHRRVHTTSAPRRP